MSWQSRLEGLDELKRRFEPAKRKAALLQTMQQVTLMISSFVKTDELSGQILKIRTGRLKASIQGLAEVKGPLIVGKIGTNVKYARIHEFGGIIRATNSPYLKFQVNGKWAQKRQVIIPRRPYLQPALTKNKDRAIRMFQKTIDTMLSGGSV